VTSFVTVVAPETTVMVLVTPEGSATGWSRTPWAGTVTVTSGEPGTLIVKVAGASPVLPRWTMLPVSTQVASATTAVGTGAVQW
jgi:hypothetical protein